MHRFQTWTSKCWACVQFGRYKKTTLSLCLRMLCAFIDLLKHMFNFDLQLSTQMEECPTVQTWLLRLGWGLLFPPCACEIHKSPNLILCSFNDGYTWLTSFNLRYCVPINRMQTVLNYANKLQSNVLTPAALFSSIYQIDFKACCCPICFVRREGGSHHSLFPPFTST